MRRGVRNPCGLLWGEPFEEAVGTEQQQAVGRAATVHGQLGARVNVRRRAQRVCAEELGERGVVPLRLEVEVAERSGYLELPLDTVAAARIRLAGVSGAKSRNLCGGGVGGRQT